MSYTIKQAVDMMPYWYEDRANNIYLLMGGPGIGKTEIVRQFAEKKGVNVVTLLASQSVPNEIAGTNGPDLSSDVMKYYEPTFLRQLKDGDILFMDELLTAPASNLAACLTMMQSRVLQGDKKLPDVMIICASNSMPVTQVSAPLRDRFWKIDIACDKNVAGKYLASKYGGNANKLAAIIDEVPDDRKWNWMTPRSVEKLISQVSKMIPEDEAIITGEGVWNFIQEVTNSYVADKFEEYWNNRVKMLNDEEYRKRCEKMERLSEDITNDDLVDTIKDATIKAMVESGMVYDIANATDKAVGGPSPEGSHKIATTVKDIPVAKYKELVEDALAQRGVEDNTLDKVDTVQKFIEYYRGRTSEITLAVGGWDVVLPEIVEQYNNSLINDMVVNSFDKLDLSTIIGTLQKMPIWDNISDILSNMQLVEWKDEEDA